MINYLYHMLCTMMHVAFTMPSYVGVSGNSSIVAFTTVLPWNIMKCIAPTLLTCISLHMNFRQSTFVPSSKLNLFFGAWWLCTVTY